MQSVNKHVYATVGDSTVQSAQEHVYAIADVRRAQEHMYARDDNSAVQSLVYTTADDFTTQSLLYARSRVDGSTMQNPMCAGDDASDDDYVINQLVYDEEMLPQNT